MRGIKAKNDYRLFAVFFVLCFLRYTLFGFRYYPILDDFIQYDGYRMYNDLKYVYFGIGTISTRPFASLLDPLFWGAMSKTASLILITLMHFFSCVLFYKTAREFDVYLSPVFGVIYLFLPLNCESIFWLSASTRVVTGLFFSSLGLYLLAKYIKTEKLTDVFGFWLFTLISCGFYEASLAFSSSASLLLMIISRKRLKHKWVFTVPFINGAVLLGVYSALSGIGAMGSRAVGFSLSKLFTLEKLSEFFVQLVKTLYNGTIVLTKNALVLGIKTLICGKFFPALVLSLIIMVSAGMFAVKKGSSQKTIGTLLFAVIMFFAPLFVSFLAEEMWITYRSLGFSVVALALIFDRLIAPIKSKTAISLISFVLCIVFTVAMVGDFGVYKEVSETDISLCTKIYESLDTEVKNGEKEVIAIFEKMPEKGENILYKDHIKSVTYADWSLTGGVRSAGKNVRVKMITPVLLGENFNGENKQIIYIDKDLNVKGER